MSHRTPDHITRVLVAYRTASGETRFLDFDHPQGAKSWTAEDWLNVACATQWVRENWLLIEATRELPFLRARLTRQAAVAA